MFITRNPVRSVRIFSALRAWPACNIGQTQTVTVLAQAVCALVLALLAAGNVPAATTLTLAMAEQLALADDPAVGALASRAQALQEAAIADGQLPDPQLRTGLYNLPLDDFDASREPTTQLRLGLVQTFPRGDTLLYKQQQGEWMASAGQARTEVEQRKLLRDVRNHFLELYYQLQAERIIRKTRALFAQLVDITEAHYATGRVSQQDVLRASLELSRLDDRSTRIQNEADRSRATLGKWIGEHASLAVADSFPQLPALVDRETIAASLAEHPLIRAETATLEASNRNIRIAREQYKPGWSAGLEYRKRFGDDPSGSDRSDMMAAMFTVDLPLFPKQRQDKRLSASIRQAESAQFTRDDKLRELRRMLETDHANWQRLGERAAIYQSQLLKESSANTQASLKAYQSGVTEFTTLMRARITDLDVRLEALRIRVDRARSHANLLYLAGENQ
jgi:outer membrane protein TolC